jgi:hypothetical protein
MANDLRSGKAGEVLYDITKEVEGAAERPVALRVE